MKYIKLYEQHKQGITFKEWLIKHPQDINTNYINCSYSNLIDLECIQQFTNLKKLHCHNNKLTSLPNLPNSLTHLYCYENNLSYLPELPKSLTHLYCSDNKLTELPELTDSLKTLLCSNNNLKSLPNLPYSLKILYCHHNNLTSLPNLPDSLVYIDCHNNNLPYINFYEYKVWYKKTYPWIYKAKNYNI